MNVILAKTAGFCFGVKRAVDTVYEEVAKDKNIYTYGPIIHNEQVVNDLADKGVKIIGSVDEISPEKTGTVIIRSHGASQDEYDKLIGSNMSVVDATCPFVKKIHNIVSVSSKEGERVVVIGSREHPEVQGIIGWCDKDNPAIVIENHREASEYSEDINRKITIVSQTTFNFNKFQELVEIFIKKGYDVNVVNTICNATSERQKEAKEIAARVDAMIVIGSSKSSNTQKLYEICSRECNNTQYVQTRDDLDTSSFGTVTSVGITAGASTPNKIIEEVQNYVRLNF